MTKVERQGLILLVLFLLTSALLCALVTGGGRAFSNIFSNMVSYIDERPAPSSETEAQYETFKQQLGSYWVAAGAVTVAGLCTLVAIVAHIVFKRRILRTWCLLLAVIGGMGIIIAWLAGQLQTAIMAIPVACAYCDSTRDGLALGAQTLLPLAGVGAGLLIIGLGLLAWSARR